MSRDDMVDAEVASTPGSNAPSTDGNDGSTVDSKKRHSKSSKPRLTAVQKNTNHKDAENKRRTAIRQCFCELCRIVPGACGQERSEQVVLTKTSEYMRSSTLECRRIEAELRQQGIQIPDEFKTKENEFGGSRWKQPNLAKYEKSKTKKIAKGTAPQDDADGEPEDDL